MAKPAQTKPQTAPGSEDDLPYTSAMRIYGGVTWATLLTLVIGVILVGIPQVPRPWLWSIPALWIGLSGLGISLQWSVARGVCPKCGYRLTVTQLGKRCPKCRSYLKAKNRKIVRV